MNSHPKIYTFDSFRFDADRLALYYEDDLVKIGDRKTMQVLAVLLNNSNKLTTHDEIIEKVWQDNPHGVTSGHIGQYISKLRKVFAEFAPEKNYIETVKGRGYSFVGNVSSNPADGLAHIKDEISGQTKALHNTTHESKKPAAWLKLPKFALVFPALILISLLTFFFLTRFSENHDELIKQVVKESQLYESLVIYKNPSSFNEKLLDKYWTAELEINTNYDRQRIREAVQKLNAEGRRYGDETKCEQFEFQSVEINQEENFAVVKTLEKWFIAVYFNDGALQKNKTVGPYFVSYILRKIDGNWLIEKSTTARLNRPTPRLTNIETVSEAKPKQQFFIKITGQDFEPETVYLEVTGEGCPASRPCKVPNSALRENSKLTETVLGNVPLTLASGAFQITARNGDSQVSNSIQINVP